MQHPWVHGCMKDTFHGCLKAKLGNEHLNVSKCGHMVLIMTRIARVPAGLIRCTHRPRRKATCI
eukprot:1158920-Pelagomonas_calceolata.AAC.9